VLEIYPLYPFNHQGVVIDIETQIIDRPHWMPRQNKGLVYHNPEKQFSGSNEQLVRLARSVKFLRSEQICENSEICLIPFCVVALMCPFNTHNVFGGC